MAIKNTEMKNVIFKFGVSGMNKNGEKLIDLCLEKKMMGVENMFCEKDIYVYFSEWGRW